MRGETAELSDARGSMVERTETRERTAREVLAGQAASDAHVAAEVREDVTREQWTLLLSNVRASTLPTLLVGALFAAFFTHYAAAPTTWIWWLVLATVLALRSWLAVPGATSVQPLRHGPLWSLYATLFATGFLWGVAPLVVWHVVDDVMLFTALLLATGMALAAFGSYGISRAAVIAVAVPIGLANLGLIAVSGNPAYYAIGVALLLLYVHQAVVMIQARRVLANQIRLRVENSLMAAQLSQHAEKTTAELERRMETERHLRASRDRAERLSATDGLTELANRRYFDKRLKSEVSRAFRDRSQLSLVICDIDYFKQYNDHYGHQQGDTCLKAFARVLESYCRRGGDLAARIGGEEFVLLLPTTEHKAALRLAEQARAGFDALAIEHLGSKLKPNATASFGVATVVPDNLDIGAELMRRADLALYRSKARGRNQVTSEQDVADDAAAS
jgi:diguanylate cyclase (GGDEF)-like protein